MNPRQMDKEDWLRHYADPQHFANLFDDYDRLTMTALRTELSTAEEDRLEAIETIIEAKIGL